MLADGWTQRQIALRLGIPKDRVASRIDQLREAMLEQALARENELPPSLRARIDEALDAPTSPRP